MADIYLRSADGDDSDDGSTWALAKATLAAALTAAGTGGTVYVADGHSESPAAAITLASPGTQASPVRVLCVDDTGDPEPPTTLATTALISNSGANQITFTGSAYVYGVIFRRAGINNQSMVINNNAAGTWVFDACSIELITTGGSSLLDINVGAIDGSEVVLHNTPVVFGAAGQLIRLGSGRFRWLNTASAVGGTAPTVLFTAPTAARNQTVDIRGVDLSTVTGTLFTVSAGYLDILLENCKLGTGVTLTTGNVAGQGGSQARVVNSDSGDTNYNYYKKVYEGEIFDEATIVRTGGASDGTTPISRRMVSSANAKFYAPLISDPIPIWIDSTGSDVTFTIETVTDGVTLTDAEAWIEVEGLSVSGFPRSTFARDRATNILSTPANQTSSSVAWTTTGLSSPVKQELSTSFTPQEKGVAYVRVHLAKASTTMYFCPKPDDHGVSTVRQFQAGLQYIFSLMAAAAARFILGTH